MSLDSTKAFECCTDDEDLEVCLRAWRNTVHVALVFDDEVRGIEPLSELVLDSFLASHPASLPRSPWLRERPQSVRKGTAVSFAPRAIQRRAWDAEP